MTLSSKSDQCQDASKRGRTLRLALAMRGGVSLAVWIGGAVAELDLFRRSCNATGSVDDFELYDGEHEQHHARGKLYRRLLAETNYDKVEIDILAGASAGGLNAVLFALAQSCCVLMDDTVRRTWVERGAIWNLLERPGCDRVSAILQGDERFFTLVRDALTTLAKLASTDVSQPLSTDAPSRLTVELAATLLGDPFSPARGRRARFSFTKTPGSLASTYTTIPCDDRDDDSKTAIARLALAARTTSSFPGAFEPAAIRSVNGEPYPRTLDTSVGVDMASAFIYGRNPGEQTEPFQVIDGGIYDNIPIDRAIQAIRRSPATNPSERKLIYLDPEPPVPVLASSDVGQSSAAGLIPVVQRSRGMQQRTESADDELAAVGTNNEAIRESRGRHAMLAAELRDLDAAGGTSQDPAAIGLPSQDLANAYLRTRIAMDGVRFAQLLTDPWSELCRPPFEASDYTALDPEVALNIDQWLTEIYSNQPAQTHDVLARLDQSRVLIGWIHALEVAAEDLAIRSQPVTDGTQTVAERLGRWKQKCYRCLTSLIAAKQRTVDLVLAQPLRGAEAVRYTKDKFAEQMSASRTAQSELRISSNLVGLIGAVEQRETEGRFYEVLGSAGAFSGQGTAGDPSWQPFLPLLDEMLDDLKTEIVDESGRWLPTDDPAAKWHKSWDATVYSAFYTAERRETTLSELTKLIATVGGPISTPIITFHRITGDEPPADCAQFDALVRGARAKQLEQWIRHLPPKAARSSADGTTLPPWPEMERTLEKSSTRPLAADAKLAGNGLNRFGGFLSARWRENDWQWGHLDAAAGLARILAKSHRNESTAETPNVEAIVGDLQSSIVLESELTVRPPVDGQTIVLTAGADTLDTISPRYAYSLAARIAPLLCRAALPSRGSAPSFQNIGLYLAQVPLRLLVVPLVLIADPLRLAWALVLVLGSAAMLGAGAGTTGWQIASSVILVIVAVGIVVRANRAAKSGSTLLARLNEIDAIKQEWRVRQWTNVLKEARTDRWRKWSLLLAGVVLASALYELIAVVSRYFGGSAPLVFDVTTEAFLAWLLFVLFVQHFLNQRAYRVQPVPRRNRGRIPVAVGAGVCAVVVVIVAEYIAHHQDSSISESQRKAGITTLKQATGAIPWWDRGPTTWLVAGVTVGLLTFLSLWGWTSMWQATAWILIAAVAAGALQKWLDHGGRVYDVMPTIVWMVMVALIHPVIAVRRDDQKYGETGRPELLLP